jgi:hypothetical protein
MPQNECPIPARIMTVHGKPLQPFAGPQSTPKYPKYPKGRLTSAEGPLPPARSNPRPARGAPRVFQEFAMLPLEKNSGPLGRPHFTLSESVPTEALGSMRPQSAMRTQRAQEIQSKPMLPGPKKSGPPEETLLALEVADRRSDGGAVAARAPISLVPSGPPGPPRAYE